MGSRFTNEGIYRVTTKGRGQDKQIIFADKDGNTDLVSVAGVYWDPYDRQVRLDSWVADSQGDSFGVRAEESGL